MERRLIATLAVVAALAVGCGDSEPPVYPVEASDEEQIRAVVESANAAFEDRDGHLLCSEVLPRDDLRTESQIDRCGETLTGEMDADPDNWPQSDLELSRVNVDGDFAEARGAVDGETSQYDFVRQQGRWWMVIFD